MKKSLDEIEAGDKVYYTSRYYSKILKVDRVTSTTIICGTEKFRKQNGRQILADTWGSSYISVLTESLEKQYFEMIRKKQLITEIKSVDLFQLSVDSLQQISDVIHNSMTDENTQKSENKISNSLYSLKTFVSLKDKTSESILHLLTYGW